jgi:hypothetical protein
MGLVALDLLGATSVTVAEVRGKVRSGDHAVAVPVELVE